MTPGVVGMRPHTTPRSPNAGMRAVALISALLLVGVATRAPVPAHAAASLKLPWAAGRWNVTQGLHNTNAWDFQPPGAGSHNDEVLAVSSGSARLTCTDGAGQAIVSLSTDAGVFRYVHLQTSAVQAVGITTGGVSVGQGQVLGRLHPSPPSTDPGCGNAIPAGASHLHLQVPTVPITIDGVTFNSAGPNSGGVTSSNTRAGSATISDGQFVSHAGHVYRVAGGAPLYVSSWNVFGGGQPTTDLNDAQFNSLRTYPADGTFVNGQSTGRVFRFAGGAPQYVASWNSYGGPQPTISVDDYTLDHPDGPSPLNHVHQYPADGTFINNVADGRVYRVAGGAPLYVASWDNIGGAQPVTSLDPFEFSAYQHLRSTPVDMFVRGLPSQRVFRVAAGGHPYYVGSWDPFGGQQPFVDVDDWAIDNCDHLNCSPFGALEAAQGTAGAVTVTGWAIDPNSASAAVTIHLYVGGPAGDPNAEGINLGTANRTRADVASSYPGTGSGHGLSATVSTSKRGTQQIYLYAINVDGTRGENVQIGTKSVTIADTLPLTAAPTPKISGTVKVGHSLTATPGAWKPAPITLTYQWLRNGISIANANKATYTLTPTDVGTTITVMVTGTKGGYTTTSKTSASTAKVALGGLTSSAAKISGTVKVGKTLTAKTGSWKPATTSFSYQWYRNSNAITRAKQATYKLTAADKGKKLKVKITGTATGYKNASRVSKRTATVTK